MAATQISQWTVNDVLAWLSKNNKKLPSSEALAVYVHQEKINGATLLSYTKEDSEKFGLIRQNNFQKILEKLHKEDARLLKDSKKRTMKDKLRRGNQSADFDSGVDDMSISESPDCRRAVTTYDDSCPSSANTSGTASFGALSVSGGSTHHNVNGVQPISYEWDAPEREEVEDVCYIAPEEIHRTSSNASIIRNAGKMSSQSNQLNTTQTDPSKEKFTNPFRNSYISTDSTFNGIINMLPGDYIMMDDVGTMGHYEVVRNSMSVPQTTGRPPLKPPSTRPFSPVPKRRIRKGPTSPLIIDNKHARDSPNQSRKSDITAPFDESCVISPIASPKSPHCMTPRPPPRTSLLLNQHSQNSTRSQSLEGLLSRRESEEIFPDITSPFSDDGLPPAWRLPLIEGDSDVDVVPSKQSGPPQKSGPPPSRPVPNFGMRLPDPVFYPPVEDYEPVSCMYENHSDVPQTADVDTDGWLAGDQMYMNHDEQEEDCDSEPDEQLYLNLPEAAADMLDKDDLTRRLTMAMGIRDAIPIRPPVVPDPMAFGPRRPLEPPAPSNQRPPPPTSPKPKLIPETKPSIARETKPKVSSLTSRFAESEPAPMAPVKPDVSQKQKTGLGGGGLSIKDRTAMLSGGNIPKDKASEPITREPSSISDVKAQLSNLFGNAGGPLQPPAKATGDLKVPVKPYRPPSRDIPKSSPISPMPDREPPKRPPNNASHPARSPPQSSARSPPQFSARSPPQLSVMLPPPISAIPPPISSLPPPANKELPPPPNCYQDVTISPLPPPPSTQQPIGGFSRPPLPVPGSRPNMFQSPLPVMGAPEPEDDALYQLEPDEDPDEIYNDGDVEEIVPGYIPNLTKRQDAEQILRNDQRNCCFLVRDSTNNPEYPHVISLKVNGSFEHTRLGLRASGRFGIGIAKSGEVTHESLSALVLYHTTTPMMLKGRVVTLRNPVSK